jgi:molybdate transport system substrate-binding protein
MAPRAWLLLFVGLALVAAGCPKSNEGSSRGDAAPPSEVILGVAASLRTVMPELITDYGKAHAQPKLTATYGGSGDLRQQVQGGAPLDVVVFAASKPVDDLVKAGLADPATRRTIATNQLVLIGPKGSKKYTFLTLDTVSANDRIAIGDPKSVPIGQYAQAALQKLGKWDSVQGKLVLGGDVASVLAYARRGEVAAAIVYKTDLHGVSDVDLFEELRGEAAQRAEVVCAVTTASRVKEDATAFAAYLASADAQKIFASYGFGAP